MRVDRVDIEARPEAVLVGLEETEMVFMRDGELSLMLMDPLLETLVCAPAWVDVVLAVMVRV